MENNNSCPRPDPSDPAARGEASADDPAAAEGPSYDAGAALADADAARHAVAGRLITPWWYHPALGTILAAIMLVAALDLPSAVRLPVALVGAAGIGVLIGAYQRTTGLWVDLRNLGTTSRRWWLAYAVIIVVVTGASLIPTATNVAMPAWLAVALAAVALLSTIVLGRRIDSVLREEIRSGVAAVAQARP